MKKITTNISRSAFFLFLVIFCLACSKKNPAIPERVLKPQEMVSILTDIHIAQAATSMILVRDSMKNTFSDYAPVIFKSHHTSQQVFDSSLQYYSANPELLDSIYKQVIDELSRKQSEVQVPEKDTTGSD